MLRNLVALALLALATPVITTPAHAAITKEEVKASKTTAKKVEKLAKKWHKSSDKGKDTTEIHAALVEYYKAELADLRQKGVPTKEKPVHPSDPQPESPDAPKLEELRDLLVELKGGEIGPKKYGNLLDQYVQRLWERYERQSQRLDRAEG